MSTLVKVGIAGWGLAGRYFHAPFIHAHEGFTLTHVVTSREVEADIFPDVITLQTFDELLATDIDLIVVAGPDHLHVSQAEAALNAGKHVVVEKPFSLTSDEAQKLVTLSEEQVKHVIPFQNRRWDGDFLTIGKLQQDGELGDLYEIECGWARYKPTATERAAWRNEHNTGVLHDLGPHMIDQMLVLLGKPEKVYGDVRTINPERTNNDYFRVILYYPNDVRAILEVDFANPMPVPRFRVKGRKATYEKHGLDPQEARLRDGIMPLEKDWGKENAVDWGLLQGTDTEGKPFQRITETVSGNYGGFYHGVYEAITKAAPPPVKAETAVLQLQIIEAALRSANTQTLQTL